MNKIELMKQLQLDILNLKHQLVEKEKQLNDLTNDETSNIYCNKFTSNEISRYSRQIIMPNIGINGQIKLKNSKVLVVGAGGLGCPASLYLTASGIGNITIIDNDEVELSNLHRQILHSENTIGVSKVISAEMSLKQLNKNVNITPLHMHLNSSNILSILKEFDVCIDGTDNVATRYLLNDACVLQNKPLVSGSALKFEGQLTVYHYGNGPCYRCLYPVPPPPETVTSCGDGGVLGAVPGCIGVLQALETIKILLNLPDILSGRMLIFDGSSTIFRNVLLRKRNQNCAMCGDNPTVTAPIDYEQFCQANAHDKGDMISVLSKDERISVLNFNKVLNDKKRFVLLDVRSKIEFDMCRLPNSINIPFSDIEKRLCLQSIEKFINNDLTVYVLCRRGNDSQRAVKLLKDQFPKITFRDIIGGLHAYSAKIDSTFPIY